MDTPEDDSAVQVAAPEDALQPLEKEFHLPTVTVTVNKSDEFSLNLKIGDDLQSVPVDLIEQRPRSDSPQCVPWLTRFAYCHIEPRATMWLAISRCAP